MSSQTWEIDPHTMNLVCCSALSRRLDTDCEDALSFILDGCDEADGSSSGQSDHNHSHNVVRNLKCKMSSSIKKSFSALSGITPKKCSTSSMLSYQSISSETALFGCSIPEGGPIPIVDLLDYLDECDHVDGLFRVSGNKRRQQELKVYLQDENFDISVATTQFNAHDIASVVKNYLLELPAPLLQQQFKDIYLQIAGLAESQRVEALQFLLLMLPPSHRELLHLLLMTLGHIASNSAVNRMDASNLAIVITPNLISIPPENQDEMHKMTLVVTDMIKHHQQIFTVHSEVELQMRVLLASMRAGEMDAPLALTHSACNQQSEEQYEHDAQVYTGQALMELFTQIQAMPEGKQKQQLLKKFTSDPMVHKSTRVTSDSSLGSTSTPPQTPHSAACNAPQSRGGSQATPLSTFRCSQLDVLDCSAATRQALKWGSPRRRRDTSSVASSSTQGNQSFCSASSLSFSSAGTEGSSFDSTSHCSRLSSKSGASPTPSKGKENSIDVAKVTRV